MTTFGGVSPASSTTMASASTVSPASFHNLTNHVILSSPTREDVNLTLSPSSSFLSNFPSMCSSTSKSSTSTFPTSSFVYSSDTKENSSRTVNNSMTHTTVISAEGDASNQVKNEDTNNFTPSATVVNSETNANDIEIPDEEKMEMKAIVVVDLDECSSNSNSLSSCSSETKNGSVRRKRRCPESEILIRDMTAMEKSLGDSITNQLKLSTSQSQTSSQELNASDLSAGPSGQNTGKGESTEDSPAFRLRPRNKNSGYSGSSGSCSPSTFLSPVKPCPSKKPTISYTQKLLKDTSHRLDRMLHFSGHNETSVSTNCHPLLMKDSLPQPTVESKPINVRSYSQSVKCDVDVSVFAELISPLNLKYNCPYPSHYLAMKITEVRPLRYVEISHPGMDTKMSSPLLELITTDINDRFSLDHAKGVFDDSSLSQASSKLLSVFLLGTYATKAAELAVVGKIVNIVKFRTTNSTRSNHPIQPPKKRKLATVRMDDAADYPLHIIVDAINDIATFKEEPKEDSLKLVDPVKSEEILQEETPIAGSSQGESPTFEALFSSSERDPMTCESNWIPLVSFSSEWVAPKDPKELNKTLYILQPCIPKFESASRTVKMN